MTLSYKDALLTDTQADYVIEYLKSIKVDDYGYFDPGNFTRPMFEELDDIEHDEIFGCDPAEWEALATMWPAPNPAHSMQRYGKDEDAHIARIIRYMNPEPTPSPAITDVLASV